MLLNLYRRHLYVRIWLAVVGGVVILTLCANWIVREAAENERERLSAVPREVVVLDIKNDRGWSST
jgi:two-component system OmpR family sensor kinase